MPWKRMLAYITGSVNEDLLRRIEYLLEEMRFRFQTVAGKVGTGPAAGWVAELLLPPSCLTKTSGGLIRRLRHCRPAWLVENRPSATQSLAEIKSSDGPAHHPPRLRCVTC